MKDAGTRFWYVPALEGRLVASDARSVPHELAPEDALCPPAGELVATWGNDPAPTGAVEVEAHAAEGFFGLTWTQAARRDATWRSHDTTPSATVAHVDAAIEAFIRTVRRRSASRGWIRPDEPGRDTIAPRRIAVHPEAPQHADFAPRPATVIVRAAGSLELRITALGEKAPRVEYRKSDGPRLDRQRHHPDLARAVAEACDARNDLRPLAIRNDTLLDAARLLAGKPRPLWLLVRDRNGGLETLERDPEAAISALAEIVHTAPRGSGATGWRLDVRDRHEGRFVMEDAASTSQDSARRPYQDEEDEERAARRVRELIERVRVRRGELGYPWNGSGAVLELVEIAAAPCG